ncbi:type II toxin-antitoxin system RelE/ParE family toxin [Arthrobacter sp. H5]|uniref:type II toxin-antitoxin system RelE family toxin n=1 Tax=Arthrobacter sp. H5 TaxID=1267973 RepID=UPI0009DE90A5|nr:type II toxin-antitoxin system RelE/ParE family toxin [Arthrobacter sp. H5]
MSHAVQFTTAAARQIRKLPRQVGSRVLDAVAALENNPRPPGATKLVGEENAWRIRVGDYRVIYDIHDDDLIITVVLPCSLTGNPQRRSNLVPRSTMRPSDLHVFRQ